MTENPYGYGLWPLVILNSAVFIIFAFSFTRPRGSRDWRSLGAFSGFIVALFAEMYGFPLTVFLLSGWLQTRVAGTEVFAHDAGHLWSTLLGLSGDPHFSVLHLVSNGFILGGFVVLAKAWRVLHAAQREGRLAQDGLYGRVRYPQYLAFILIMVGFLLQWPTLPTLVMFPILLIVYARLARREEADALRAFGDEYARYRARVPAFIPSLNRTEERRA